MYSMPMTTRTDASILETENLSFMDFLHFPNLNIPEKQANFITGESGTGKSTLLRLFNNAVSPSSGVIRFSCLTIPFPEIFISFIHVAPSRFLMKL